ncbi:MAG: PAS domain S-box protein [Anaerolineae bacterium]|nr:PAS domain S-box protein [Anaerolineae bacterium]
MDYPAIIQALQTISKEIELPSLLTSFMKIVLQQTKAHMAMILLENYGQWHIAAKSVAEQGDIKVIQAAFSDKDVPVSFAFFERVIRSHEKVFLPKSSQKQPTSEVRPSFVIYPLLASQQLQALLYLECSSADSTMFEILEILGQQAAISLANAKTYHDLQDTTTEQKAIEQTLKDSEYAYRRLVELSFDSVAIHINTKYVYVNLSGARLFGFDRPEDLIGRSVYDFVHPDDLETVNERIQKTQTEGFEVTLTEQKIVRSDGTVLHVEVAAVPITYQGQAAIQAIIRDVSHKKLSEAKLKASEEKFRTLTETMAVAVFIYQGDKNCYVNHYAEHITGYTQNELVAMNFWDIVHPDYKDLIKERGKARQEGRDTPSRYELKLIAKDGSERWIESTLGLIEYEGKPAVLGTSFEITTRKKIEAERRQLLQTEHEQRLVNETLANVFLALASPTTLEDVLNEILVQVQKIIAYDAADIALLKKNDLRIVHWQGYEKFGNEKSNILTTQHASDFPVDRTILRNKQPLVIADTYKHPQWVIVPEFEWIRSFIGLPLNLGDRAVGILRLVSNTPRQFTSENLKQLHSFARAAAIAIGNAQLYEQVSHELSDRKIAEQALSHTNQQLLALQNAGAILAFSRDSQFVLETVSIEMTNLINVQSCIIYDWHSKANTISIAANYNFSSATMLSNDPQRVDNYPIIKRVLQSRRSEQIHITQNYLSKADREYMQSIEAKTIVVFAMEYQDQLLGVVVAAEQKKARRFEYEEMALAQFLANQAASAIENARLFEKAQREIIERQRTEAALKESEANLKAIFDNSLQTFILLDHNYTIRSLNKSARYGLQLLTHKTVSEGNNFLDIAPDRDIDTICHHFDRALRGESTQHEYKIGIRNTDYWLECHYDPVVDDNSKVAGVCFSTIDISDRKKTAEALAAARARLWDEVHALLENTQTLVSRSSQEGLLEAIVNRAKSLMKAKGVAVILLNKETQEAKNITPKIIDLSTANNRQLFNSGSLIETALSKQQLQVSSLIYEERATKSIQRLLKLPKASTLVCAPLLIHHKKLGVLLLWRNEAFQEHDLNMVSAFASQAALGIESANLHRFNQQLAIQHERQRLARGLHDSVTQSIYSIGLAAETALKFLKDDSDSKSRAPIEYIHALSKSGLTEMREQLYRLHPVPLRDKDLVSALAEHCEQLSHQYELLIDFQASLKTPLTLIQQDELYYIARETLWNVIKHAQATHVELLLTQENSDILLSIKDNGAGFDLLILEQTETFGLRSVIERAELLNGYVIPQSKPGQGTYIMVRIPVGPDQTEIQTTF